MRARHAGRGPWLRQIPACRLALPPDEQVRAARQQRSRGRRNRRRAIERSSSRRPRRSPGHALCLPVDRRSLAHEAAYRHRADGGASAARSPCLRRIPPLDARFRPAHAGRFFGACGCPVDRSGRAPPRSRGRPRRSAPARPELPAAAATRNDTAATTGRRSPGPGRRAGRSAATPAIRPTPDPTRRSGSTAAGFASHRPVRADHGANHPVRPAPGSRSDSRSARHALASVT